MVFDDAKIAELKIVVLDWLAKNNIPAGGLVITFDIIPPQITINIPVNLKAKVGSRNKYRRRKLGEEDWRVILSILPSEPDFSTSLNLLKRRSNKGLTLEDFPNAKEDLYNFAMRLNKIFRKHDTVYHLGNIGKNCWTGPYVIKVLS